MSKVVKELPPDPIDFLIKKLQLLQRRRKKVQVRWDGVSRCVIWFAIRISPLASVPPPAPSKGHEVNPPSVLPRYHEAEFRLPGHRLPQKLQQNVSGDGLGSFIRGSIALCNQTTLGPQLMFECLVFPLQLLSLID